MYCMILRCGGTVQYTKVPSRKKAGAQLVKVRVTTSHTVIYCGGTGSAEVTGRQAPLSELDD